ncbi:MAG: PSD1 and planctomycete cytochrome C domain-containing protein [Bryobacteraceae bacterium]
MKATLWFAIYAGAVCGQETFTTEVAPILKRRCIACHGAAMQTNGFRVDDGAAVVQGGYSGAAVVPGKPAESKLITRLRSNEKETMMPPTGARLSADEIEVIAKWIESGAKVPASTAKGPARRPSSHWAFQPVKKSPVPADVNAIDYFIRERLKKEGLQASPEADRRTLARRLKLDLLGLAPTLGEVDAFVNDMRPDALERLVDQYLASPHYGERWARPWLDLARYADSDGYETDNVRPHAWRYRQWVIDALNSDMGFDRFTIAQTAGDLLPGATTEDRVATGFHRNVLTNREAGVDRAEARYEQLINRTNTLGTAWLGLTVGCAQCHDHKFDPFSQREFYQLYAFFNEADDVDIDAPLPGERGPYLKALPAYRADREKLLNEYKIPDLQARWEEKMRAAYANPGKDAEFDFWITSMSAMVDHAMRMLHKKPAERTDREVDILADYFIANPGPEFGRDKELTAKLKELRAKVADLKKAMPFLTQAYTIGAHPENPKSHITIRGDYRAPGIEVKPGTPAVLPPMAVKPGEPSRLAFARWLVSKDNPLTPRVTVNRAWQEFFGRGLVRTSEDFGATGEKPSHPELLDWLAAEFMEQGWSLKKLHKTIVMSATYRQASKYRPDAAEKDADNTLLSRQSRLRLPAELIRDTALQIGGILNPEIGGKSVMPFLPKGVGELAYGGSKWKETFGREAYRRGLYIHYQRTTPYPLLVNFDAPDSNVACSRRRPSNTPLQALNLLNDPVFLEASNAFAIRALETAASSGDRLESMFIQALGRPPSETERQSLARYIDKQTDVFNSEGKTGDLLARSVWSGVARVLFNLDEFINRE